MAEIASLVAGDAAAFELLLQQLMAPDNAPRTAAERAFEELKAHPDACALHLVRSLRSSANLQSRSLAAVLLRKASYTQTIHSRRMRKLHMHQWQIVLFRRRGVRHPPSEGRV
jgi:hypothetical protein